MLPIEKVKKWLIENRTDKYGNLDLLGLDFSDFGGNVNISCWKVKKSLFQNFQEVGGTLCQDDQKVGGDILQCYQSSGGYIYQHSQKAKYLVILGPQPACTKEVAMVITDDNKGKYVETIRNRDFEGLNSELVETCEPEDTKREDERECVGPNYEAEYERLRKELYEADRKIETLMWALEKAMEASK